MGLSALALPDTDAPIIDELALASDANPITRTQDDAALVDRDRLRTLDEVMGIEGACSNAYFDALCACVPADVTFNRRSRRPPRDLPNAAPSDGYAILLSEYVSALHAAGLEPSIGIAPRPPTSATAWRWTSWNSSAHSWSTKPSWLCCARASSGPNTASSRPRPGGVWLGADGKKILVDAYEAACQRSVTGTLPGYSGSWRRHIAHSAQMLARAIAEPDYQWCGVAWR